MFVLINSKTKITLLYFVLSDRTQLSLLPIVKKNILANEIEEIIFQETKILRLVFILTVSEPTS